MPRTHEPPKSSPATVVVAAVLVVGTLYVARDVLIPFSLAVLFGFLLSPLVTRIQRLGLGRVPAVIAAVAFSLLVVAGVGWLVAAQANALATELPRYRSNIVEKVRKVRASLGGSIGEASQAITEIRKEIAAPPATRAAAQGPRAGSAPANSLPSTPGVPATAPGEAGGVLDWGWGAIISNPGRVERAEPRPLPVTIEPGESGMIQWLRVALEPFLGPVANAGIAAVFVVFMLIQREELRDRLIRLIGRGHLNVTTEAINDAARRVSRYLIVQVFINALNGAAVAAGLALIGLPGALFWGLTTALLRFVPYVGSWIAAAMPIVLSLAVFDGWARPMLVAGLLLFTALASASILEPWLYGARIGASPIAVLASTVFWTWLWGGVGLFLATPLTVCLIVIGRYVPQLEFLAVMLSDEPALPPHVRVYQRLLAMDEQGAQDIVRQLLKETSRAELHNSLVVPVLQEAERDRRRGTLDGHREAFIRQAVSRLIETWNDDAEESVSEQGPPEMTPDERPRPRGGSEPLYTHRSPH